MLKSLKGFHPLVYTLLIGNIFETIAMSMSIPFLAIYLTENTSISPGWIGWIIGMGPLASMIGGYVGGTISDRIGRKKLMLFSLLSNSFVCIGYSYVSNPLMFMILAIFGGLCGSLFNPVSKALIGDVTEKHKRLQAFSFLYLARNIGHAIGPLFGAIIGLTTGMITFLFTGIFYIFYAIILYFLLIRFGINKVDNQIISKVSMHQSLQVILHDRALRWFVLGGILSVMVHGQMSVTLSQHLKRNFIEGATLYSFLLSINSIVVIVGQVPISRWLERKTPIQGIVLGSILFAIGEIGFAISQNWWMFILSMIIFTIGEICVIPSEYAIIDEITPNQMRGTYYGAQTFTNFGNFLGPWLGSMVLGSFGGPAMFCMFAFIALLSIVFYWHGKNLYQQGSNRFVDGANQKSPSNTIHLQKYTELRIC